MTVSRLAGLSCRIQVVVRSSWRRRRRRDCGGKRVRELGGKSRIKDAGMSSARVSSGKRERSERRVRRRGAWSGWRGRVMRKV